MASFSVFLRPTPSDSFVPRPAAAITGLMPLRVASFGSAPFSRSKRNHDRIAGFGRAQDRRGAGSEHRVVAAIDFGPVRLLSLQLHIDRRAMSDQRL